MVASPHKCGGDAGRVCNCFLPVVDEDPHTLFDSCTPLEPGTLT